jgi:hypothetical protein
MSVRKNPSTKGLLAAGAKSYPEALAAISEFCREIQTVLRTSLSNDLASLAKAMAIKMEKAQIKNYATPDSFTKDISGEWAALGVKIDRRNKPEGRTQIYFHEWDEGETFVTAKITFTDRVVAKRVYDRLSKVQRNTSELGFNQWFELFIRREISPQEMDRLGEITGEVNREWSALWKRAGGLKRSMRL